jgi:hypothetical protein
MVDEIWSRYETDLAAAIDKSIDRSLEANEWARILVAFIVGLLVRHPEFNLRFNNRLPDLSDSVKNPDIPIWREPSKLRIHFRNLSRSSRIHVAPAGQRILQKSGRF